MELEKAKELLQQQALFDKALDATAASILHRSASDGIEAIAALLNSNS